MRIQLLVAVVLSFSSILNGQERQYRGKVIDAKYHTPVAYAAVYIHSTNHGAVANNVGEFSFNTPESTRDLQLVVAKDGYKLAYVSNEHITPSEIIILLQPDDSAEIAKMLEDSLAGKSGGFSYFINKATGFVKDDWIPLGNPETNKFDFGRIQTFPTYNPIEGVRLRAGFASNSRLNPHIFIKGYAAYGFGDDRFKYRGEITYSFDKKAYHEEEFLKNNIRIIYENDLYSPGEMHPRSQNNLLLITYRRSENEATYRNFAEINWEREHKNGLAHTTWLRRSRMIPQGELNFQRNLGDVVLVFNELNTNEFGLQLRYSAREAYIQKKRKRIPIDITSPVIFLSHVIGFAQILGSNAPYH